MRLLKRSPDGEIGLTKDLIDDIPAYAILSHTWGAEDDEVTIEDIENGQVEGKAGWTKIQFCGKQAEKDGLQYFWIDTCSINRANHAELSEAITSMFRWYRNAAKCYVYLSNMSATTVRDDDQCQHTWEAAFRKSRWFTRGWTLQELLAPSSVEFFSHEGVRLGNKKSLERLIHEITTIPVSALRGEPLSHFSVDERLRWTTGRNTKKPEDQAYCLLGIFNVFMPLIYGEGDNAFIRLEEEIEKRSRSQLDLDKMQHSIPANFEKPGDIQLVTSDSLRPESASRIRAWLSPANPRMHHERTSKARAEGSGTWFLERKAFRQWASSAGGGFLWLRGITGAGKTTLMSTVIDELLRRDKPDTAVGYFYCSFDDKDSQLTANMFGSILAQFAARDPQLFQELSALYRDKLADEGGKAKPLLLEEMTDKLLQSSRRHAKTFIAIDAVNEASEPFLVLETLKSLAPNCTIIMSSVNTAGFEQYLQPVSGLSIQTIRMSDIQDDVEIYVRTFLETHDRMRGLPPSIKERIVASLTSDSNGMFRWVQCQLVQLAHLKTPAQIRSALTGMPVTLDQTYESILSRIDQTDREMVKEILLLLTFCLRPLTLDEVCEALQITPGRASLDEDKLLLYPLDVVSVCGGLVDFDEDTRTVFLAHHSVRMYLTNPDLTNGSAAYFGLSEDEAHRHFAERCLTYLSFDAFADGPCLEPSQVTDRLDRFPFLAYAAHHWALHAGRLDRTDPSLSAAIRAFFANPTKPGRENFLAWVQVLLPEQKVRRIAGTSPLYYAASFGLAAVVEYLVDQGGVDIQAHGGRFGATPLGIAAFRGHADVVQVLLGRGADPYIPDISPGLNAVDWARHFKHQDVLKVFEEHERQAGQAKRASRANVRVPRDGGKR